MGRWEIGGAGSLGFFREGFFSCNENNNIVRENQEYKKRSSRVNPRHQGFTLFISSIPASERVCQRECSPATNFCSFVVSSSLPQFLNNLTSADLSRHCNKVPASKKVLTAINLCACHNEREWVFLGSSVSLGI